MIISRKSFAGVIAAAIGFSSLLNPVAFANEGEAGDSAADLAFAEFERKTVEDVAKGIPQAITNAEKISNFTNEELEGFKTLLASGAVQEAVSGEENLPEHVDLIQTDNVSEKDPNMVSPAAWQGYDYIEGCLTNTLYGVEVLKVCTGGGYYSNVGMATSIQNPRTYVKYNNAPGLQVTATNPRGFVEGTAPVFYGDISTVAFPNLPWVGPIGTTQGTHRVIAQTFPNSVVLNYFY